MIGIIEKQIHSGSKEIGMAPKLSEDESIFY